MADLVERRVGRVVVFRAISMSERRALLTASSFGKAWNTFGLRTMTFDDSFMRSAYLPRTRPPGKSDRLYFARSSSLSGSLFFFINFSFSSARFTGAYNSNCVPFLGVRYHKKPTFFRNAEGNIALFCYGVIRICTGCSHGIAQGCRSFFERDTVLLKI